MQLLDHEAVAACTGAGDVLVQLQAGDHHVGGQRRRQLVGQRPGAFLVQLSGQLFFQQQAGLGGVGQDEVGPAAELPHPIDEGRGHGRVSLAVVAHHGVYHLIGRGPEVKGLFGQRGLLLASEVAGVNAVEAQPQLPVMFQCGLAVGAAVQTGRCPEAAGVGGEHHRGQCHRLDAHDAEHRQDDRQTAASHTGKVMDAENFFRFRYLQQKRNLLRGICLFP